MKRTTIFFLVACLFAGLGFNQSLEAQSRKKLKEEIAKLQQEVVRLTQDLTTTEAQVNQLQSENQRYAEQNAALSSQVTQLQQDNLALSQQYQTVLKNYEAVTGGSGGVGTTPGTTPGAGTAPPAGGTGTLPPVSGDARKCAYYQGKLTPNTSYTEYFNVLQSSGFGVQVFSTKSLCQAAEYAEKFN